MGNFWQDNKRVIIAGLIGLVAIIIVGFGVPSTVPDTEHPVINVQTHNQEPGKMVNPNFVFLMGIAALAPIIYLFTMKEEQEFTRKRSLVQVWRDIPKYELVKYGLRHIKEQQFVQDSHLIPTSDTNLFVVRVPDYFEGKNYYLALDMMEDWKMRNKDSPLFTFWKSNFGEVQAKNTLVKSTTGRFARFTQEAKGLGLSPKDIKRQVYIQQLNEAERRRREIEEGGEID